MGTKRPWVVEVFNLWRQARDVPQMCHESGMMFSRPKCPAGQLIRRSWWGTGIYHSEHNLAKEPLRFIQCWVVPCKCTGRYWKCHNAKKTIWVWWFGWWFLSVSRWLSAARIWGFSGSKRFKLVSRQPFPRCHALVVWSPTMAQQLGMQMQQLHAETSGHTWHFGQMYGRTRFENLKQDRIYWMSISFKLVNS